MPELQTSPTLLKALREAAKRHPSAAEIRNQRISFILGSLGDKSTVTRERVTEVLAEQEGEKEAS